jgi:hypothetical protein
MRIFFYAFGGFQALVSFALFLMGNPSGGLFFLFVSLVFFGLAGWVQYEQGSPMRERLAEEQRRHQNEIYLLQRRREVEERRGATEVDSDKWRQDHHRGNLPERFTPPKKPLELSERLQAAYWRRHALQMALKEKDVPVSNVSDSDTHWVENRVIPQKQKFGVSHRGAEELTAEWLVYLGEQGVSITQFSSDGGVDVLTSTYCCQVKNYDKKPVGVVEVRALLGTAVSKKLMPLLFTASKLTNEALAFSEQNRIAVVEFNAMDSTLSGLTLEGEKLLDSGRYK